MRVSQHCYAVTGLGYTPPWTVNAGFLAGREIWDPKERYIYEGELEEDWDSIRA